MDEIKAAEYVTKSDFRELEAKIDALTRKIADLERVSLTPQQIIEVIEDRLKFRQVASQQTVERIQEQALNDHATLLRHESEIRELRGGVSEIKQALHTVSQQTGTIMTEMVVLTEGLRESRHDLKNAQAVFEVEAHMRKKLLEMMGSIEERVRQNNTDIDDIRVRLAETIMPMHSYILGDKTRPALADTISQIQGQVVTLADNIKPLADHVERVRARNQLIREFLMSRAGAAAVGATAPVALGLLGRVDFAVIGHFLLSMLGG